MAVCDAYDAGHEYGYELGCSDTHDMYATPIEGMKATIERLMESNRVICELADIPPQLVIDLVNERKRDASNN